MPIYAYRCAACGYAKDVLQKMSDAPLTVCPQCGAESMVKQVTAAGFQLKGSGWYVTDFRGDSGGGGKDKAAQSPGEGSSKPASDASGGSAAAKGGDASGASKPAAPAAAPAPSSAPAAAAPSSSGSGGSSGASGGG